MANNEPNCFHFYTGYYDSSGGLIITYEDFFCANTATIVSAYGNNQNPYILEINSEPWWFYLTGVGTNSTFNMGTVSGVTYVAVCQSGLNVSPLSKNYGGGSCGNCTSSYNCTLGSCVQTTGGGGTYATLSACQSGCQPLPTNYDCFNGACTQNTNGTGIYSSLGDCQAACGGPTCTTGQLCATPSTICAGTCCTGGQSCADPSSICSGTCCPAGQSCYDPDTLSGLCQSSGSCPTCPTCPTCPEDNVQFSTINAQIFQQCDSSGIPVYATQAVSVIAGTEDAEILKYKELSEIYAWQNCKSSADCAAIPLGWQIRPEASRPQAIFQFAEVDGSGNITGSPKYPITVPHLVNNPPTNPLPNYTKGNYELIYVLNDNSRITIHAMDQNNANTVLNAIIPLLDTNYTSKAYTSKSGLVVTQTPIAQNLVTCRMVKYYSTGVQASVPDWIVKWD